MEMNSLFEKHGVWVLVYTAVPPLWQREGEESDLSFYYLPHPEHRRPNQVVFSPTSVWFYLFLPAGFFQNAPTDSHKTENGLRNKSLTFVFHE